MTARGERDAFLCLRASPCGLRFAVDFPSLRARAQEMRGDPNQVRDSVRKP